MISTQYTNEYRILRNLEDTIELGKTLPNELPGLKILLLQGPLGAGKTSLVKGLAKSLGIEEPITSPSFALAQHYPKGKPPLIHLDLYRLEKPKDADELFLQEEEEANKLGAIVVIEWPKRLSLAIPEAWQINLDYQSEGGRIAHFIAPSEN